ncbi:MAG: hypothetical protein JW870_18800 [Candidatus Delongbacteria bacterium]|nr:hypothetical protein [Candidatus Delongbacteria bacterium]
MIDNLEKEKMAKYKRLNLFFYLIFFIFNFQNLILAEYLNSNCDNTKRDFLSIEYKEKIFSCRVAKQHSDDSYTACKKMVLFFTLSKDEFDCLDEEIQWQISDALDDFIAHSNIALQFLDEHSIHHDWIRVRKIKLIYDSGEKEEIDLDKENTFAWILFDRVKKPKIFFEVYTSTDMISEIENYFEIKKK